MCTWTCSTRRGNELGERKSENPRTIWHWSIVPVNLKNSAKNSMNWTLSVNPTDSLWAGDLVTHFCFLEAAIYLGFQSLPIFWSYSQYPINSFFEVSYNSAQLLTILFRCFCHPCAQKPITVIISCLYWLVKQFPDGPNMSWYPRLRLSIKPYQWNFSHPLLHIHLQ